MNNIRVDWSCVGALFSLPIRAPEATFVNEGRVLQGVGDLRAIRPCAPVACISKLFDRGVDRVPHLLGIARGKPDEFVEASWIVKRDRVVSGVQIEVRTLIVADLVFSEESSRRGVVVSGAIVWRGNENCWASLDRLPSFFLGD